MIDEFTDKEGEDIVQLARTAVSEYLTHSRTITAPESTKFSNLRGVFVTLNYLSLTNEEHLRGCIGFPYPERKLGESIVDSAIAAATQDPRFPPLRKQDLNRIVFEVSVLSLPLEIETKEYDKVLKEIKVGRDGLLLKSRHGSGLLLPQVPVEMQWDVSEFLENLCYKAGVSPDEWIALTSKIYKFEAIIFKETKPSGRVVRICAEKHHT